MHRLAVAASVSFALAGAASIVPAQQGLTAAAQRAPTSDEVPCTALRSSLHGVVLLGARTELTGGPPCALMQEYGDWLERSDALLTSARVRDARFSGREWDFAAGAMRLGAPDYFVLIRGDSLAYSPPGRPRRLHLSAFAAEPSQAPTRLGSWYVMVDEDSAAMRLFRSPVTEKRLHQVLEDRGSIVYAVSSVTINAAHVRSQLAEARALRAALGITEPLPRTRFIVGPARDTTLSVLGVREMWRPLFAMTVFPPLAVFAPLTARNGLDPHELVHVATFGRRDVVPASVGEAFAMHHGGSHGRDFSDAFCANRTIRALDSLTVAQLDSALDGLWWDDPRADVTGFALGHAMGWFLAQRGDSSWVFADGEPAKDNDAIAFLAARSGLARETAMAAIVEGFGRRRASCAPQAGARIAAPAASTSRPSGVAGVPGRALP